MSRSSVKRSYDTLCEDTGMAMSSPICGAASSPNVNVACGQQHAMVQLPASAASSASSSSSAPASTAQLFRMHRLEQQQQQQQQHESSSSSNPTGFGSRVCQPPPSTFSLHASSSTSSSASASASPAAASSSSSSLFSPPPCSKRLRKFGASDVSMMEEEGAEDADASNAASPSHQSAFAKLKRPLTGTNNTTATTKRTHRSMCKKRKEKSKGSRALQALVLRPLACLSSRFVLLFLLALRARVFPRPDDLLQVPRSFKKQAIAAALATPSSSSHATPVASSPYIPGPPSSSPSAGSGSAGLPNYHHQLFTYDQVASIVRNAIDMREKAVRAEYDLTLQRLLAEQFESFSNFNKDYISRSMNRGEQQDADNSYYS